MTRVFKSLVASALLTLGSCSYFISSHHDAAEYTEMFAAASAGNVPFVEAALNEDPKLIRATEWESNTLLHNAVQRDQEQMTDLLLKRGADVNARTSDGLRPLHMAAQNGNVPIIRMLISHRARINPVDGKGWTPLDRAVKWRHPEAAKVIEASGGRSGERQ